MSELAQHGDISSLEPAEELSGWKNIAGLTAAVLMAVVWLGAGLWKLTIISQLQLMLTQLLVPVSLSLPATIAVIIGDLTAGVLLLRPEWRRMGGLFSTALLVVFMGYFAINYEALRGADCSCFPWVKRSVGPVFFWIDGAMVALSLLAAWFAPRVGGLRRAAYVVAGIAAILMVASWGCAASPNISERGAASRGGLGRPAQHAAGSADPHNNPEFTIVT